MNCEQCQQNLLLAQSGELDARGQVELEQHVQQCAACLAYREDLRRITHWVSTSLPTGAPRPATVISIKSAAREQTTIHAARRRKPPVLSAVLWHPVMAAAAAFLVLLGGWFFVSRIAGVWTDRADHGLEWFGTRFERSPDYDALIRGVHDEALLIEHVSNLMRDGQVTDMDLEIMVLEGLAI